MLLRLSAAKNIKKKVPRPSFTWRHSTAFAVWPDSLRHPLFADNKVHRSNIADSSTADRFAPGNKCQPGRFWCSHYFPPLRLLPEAPLPARAR